MGTTYKALDTQANTSVALKALELAKIENLKELELFEREIEVLKTIDNPNIPNYIENFQTEISGQLLYLLVQEFVDGKNLYSLVKKGKRFTESEILKFLESLLKTLAYIHNLKPPIIHRDINPKNIILNNNKKLYLVDFGAVGRGRRNTLAGAKSDTFVGTLGYMPPEQLYGRLHPGLDIYALGVTALFLISGREPWEFPLKNIRINYQHSVRISVDLRYLIDKMIEPDYKKRLTNANRALSLVKEITGLITEEEKYKAREEKKADKADTLDLHQVQSEWLKQAMLKCDKEKKQAEFTAAEKERKKKQKENRKKRRELRKNERQRKKAEEFPGRIKIIEHNDGSELIIKPYPFLRLFKEVHWHYLPACFWIIILPIALWIFAIGFIWELLEELYLDFYIEEELYTTLFIISIPLFFYTLCFLFFLFITILTRISDQALHIRLATNNYCAIYKRSPRNAFFIGKKNQISVNTINNSSALPGKKGPNSIYWGSIEISTPGIKKQLRRSGLPQKDLDLINDFLIEQGIK